MGFRLIEKLRFLLIIVFMLISGLLVCSVCNVLFDRIDCLLWK